MGGTGHPLSVPPDTPTFINDYVNGADSGYIAPSGLCSGGSPGCTLLAVYTPEQFRFDTGFTDMTFDQSVAGFFILSKIAPLPRRLDRSQLFDTL